MVNCPRLYLSAMICPVVLCPRFVLFCFFPPVNCPGLHFSVICPVVICPRLYFSPVNCPGLHFRAVICPVVNFPRVLCVLFLLWFVGCFFGGHLSALSACLP